MVGDLEYPHRLACLPRQGKSHPDTGRSLQSCIFIVQESGEGIVRLPEHPLIQDSLNMFLIYGGDKELIVNGYVDASFDTDPDDSKSQTGYVFTLNGGAVSWCSSKQSVVAGSTCEAEYIAASEAANEGVWMKEFISDLGVIPSASGPMKIFCDNTGAIALAKESRFHKRTKHIKRRFNSIRDLVQVGDIEICKIHTDLNVADPLTKASSTSKHDQRQSSMGVRIITV